MTKNMDKTLVEIHAGPARVVRVTPKVKKVFDKWMKTKGAHQAKFKKMLERYGQDGDDVLRKLGQLKFQRSIKVKGVKISVQELKGWQIRIYGEPTTFWDGMPGFVGAEIDIKKNDNADDDTLKRTAEYLLARKQK